MPTYSVSRNFAWQGQITEKVAGAMRMFGLTVERLGDRGVSHICTVEINAGDIVYITGPSGSGKSVLLGELEQSVPASEKVNLSEIELPADRCVVDCLKGDLLKCLKVLSIAGLNDVFCILNQPANLSDGEKYRFRIAMALAGGKRFVFADEFCSGLDRITAAAIAYNIQKFAKRAGVTFILASSHEDTLVDLSPDVLVVKQLSGLTEVIYKERRSQRCGVVV